MQDFPEPAAGEQEEPDRGGREGSDLGEAVLWCGQMLRRRLLFVYVPCDSLDLGFADSSAKPFHLPTGEESFAAVFRDLVDAASGVRAFSDGADPAGERIHTADHRQNA